MSGMNLWQARVYKQLGTEQWSNTYVVQAATLSAAADAGQAIVAIERNVHMVEVAYIKLDIEPITLPAGGGTSVPLSLTGAKPSQAPYLPLHDTIRCWFRPAAGKPSMKYLRGPISETRQNDGVLEAAWRGVYQDQFVVPLLGEPRYVDVDGQAFVSGGVHPLVQLRQLSWKRRSRPGQKRGWVAK